MSGDELVIARIARLLDKVKLDYVLIGGAAAALQGLPLVTADVDVYVRDTKKNMDKIKQFAKLLGGAISEPLAPVGGLIRVSGAEVSVDIVFQLSSGTSFNFVRSRAKTIRVEQVKVKVASLEDILPAKKAAGRARNQKGIMLIEQTIKIIKATRRPNRRRRRGNFS
jgi:predicted nucleotidyltransferase